MCDVLSRTRLRKKENCVLKTQIHTLWGLIPYWIGQVYGKVVSRKEFSRRLWNRVPVNSDSIMLKALNM